MSLHHLFVRFFETDENGDEIPGTSEYVSVLNLAEVGPPMDENENAKDCDAEIYIWGSEGTYETVQETFC